MSLILPRSFYARPPEAVAPDLIGKILVHGGRESRIVEVEAYPHGDPASHSTKGPTARTQVLFGPPGYAYVYLIYGIHECFNISCQPDGQAGCVLIRALEAVSGPGRLTRWMGITRAHNGADLTRGPLMVRDGPVPAKVRATPRIGISKSREALLRFVIAEHLP
jgi:DNA-3-methyladenine glycosylase